MTDVEAAKRRGKDAYLTARIPTELKAALDAEAERAGKTISQVALGWMETGREGGSGGFPGGSVGVALRRLATFADLIRQEVGDPESSFAASLALKSGWSKLAHALPPPAPGPEERAVGAARGVLAAKAAALLALLRSIAERDPNDALLSVLASPQEPTAVGLLMAPSPNPRERLSVVELLLELTADTAATAELLMKRLGALFADHREALVSHPQVLAAIREVQEAAHAEIDAQQASMQRMTDALRVSDDLARTMLRDPDLMRRPPPADASEPEPR